MTLSLDMPRLYVAASQLATIWWSLPGPLAQAIESRAFGASTSKSLSPAKAGFSFWDSVPTTDVVG